MKVPGQFTTSFLGVNESFFFLSKHYINARMYVFKMTYNYKQGFNGKASMGENVQGNLIFTVNFSDNIKEKLPLCMSMTLLHKSVLPNLK